MSAKKDDSCDVHFLSFFFFFFYPRGQISPSIEYWLNKSSIAAMQAWQGFSLRHRIRQNGLYLIPQSLIRQTFPFHPLGPALPWRKKKREQEGRGWEERKETVRNFLHMKGWDSMSEELFLLLCIAGAEPFFQSKLVTFKTFQFFF